MSSKVAYGVYTYQTGVSPVGELGVASYDGATAITLPVQPVSLSRRDPKAFYFKDLTGKNCIFMAGTDWKNQKAVDGQYAVYDENLNLLVGPSTTDAVVNLYALTGPVNLGDQYQYLYGIDYDLHKVIRYRVSAGSGLMIDATWNDFEPTKGNGYGIDVVTDGKYVYALFASAVNPFSGDYDSYSIVQLDMALKKSVKLTVSGVKNPFSLDLFGGNLFVTVLGGMQNYGSTNGEASMIQRISVSGFSASSKVTTVLKGGKTADTGDFRALSFANGDAYILTGCLNSDKTTFSGALYCVESARLLTVQGAGISDLQKAKYAINKIDGWTWGLFYSATDNAVWMAQGESVGVYKGSSKEQSLTQAAICSRDTLVGTQAKAKAQYYHLNSVTLIEPGKALKGYVPHAFASVSEAAILEREKLLKK